MRLVLDLIYAIAMLAASPWLLYRTYRAGSWSLIPARFGFIRSQASRPTVWLHGSSVGEVGLMAPLIRRIERCYPGCSVVISSFTTSGVRAAATQYPGHTVLPLPFDFSFVVERVLSRLAPAAIVILETDIWPNLLESARRRAVPVALVNARMSARSRQLYRRTGILKRHFAALAAVATQSEEHSRRFAELGVPADRIVTVGNVKYDLVSPPQDRSLHEAVRSELGVPEGGVVVIGASLHLPEDEALLEAFAGICRRFAHVRLVIVPRYPADGPAIAENAARRGFQARLRSAGDPFVFDSASPNIVLVVDTLGELRRLYHAADVAFVGGSLYYRGATRGGHNMIEPAALGVAVVFGRHTYSFKDTVADLLRTDAARVVADERELEDVLTELVEAPAARAATGERGRRTVMDGRGATERSFGTIAPMLEAALLAGHSGSDDNAPVPN